MQHLLLAGAPVQPQWKACNCLTERKLDLNSGRLGSTPSPTHHPLGPCLSSSHAPLICLLLSPSHTSPLPLPDCCSPLTPSAKQLLVDYRRNEITLRPLMFQFQPLIPVTEKNNCSTLNTTNLLWYYYWITLVTKIMPSIFLASGTNDIIHFRI